MVQTNESAMTTYFAREASPSSLRPTIYRPSRPVTTRISGVDKREPTNPATRTGPDRSGLTRRPDQAS